MANKDNLRIATVEAGLKKHCEDVLNAIDDAAVTTADRRADLVDWVW